MDLLKILEDLIKKENVLYLPLTFLFVFLGWLYFNYNKIIEGTLLGNNEMLVEQANEVSDEGKSEEEEEEQNEEELHNELKELLEKLGTDDIDEVKKAVNLDMNDPLSVKQYVTRLRSKAYMLELSQTDREKEEEVKQQQLAKICALLNKSQDTSGETSWTSEHIEEQLSMYVK